MSYFSRLATFVRANHRYVYLGTSVIAALGLASAQELATSSSFLYPTGIVQDVLWGFLWAWLALAAAALASKIVLRARYAETSLFSGASKRGIPAAALRWGSYLIVLITCLFIVDRYVVGTYDFAMASIALDSNPPDFLSGLIYMTYKSWPLLLSGIGTTIALAFFGTIIAFFLGLILVFVYLQQFDRVDNDFVRFVKTIGRGFARLYSTIVRGTPMMVQALLIYAAGFVVVRGFGLNTAEANAVWSQFSAGLVTISLNSTAYLMEVLRGGIEAVDPGQAEAARSLGLSQWQAMRRVVFPQGIKHAIPALTNEIIINIKDSSVLSAIGVFDLYFATTTIAGLYYRQMEVYVVAMAIYLVLTLIAGRMLEALGRKLGASESKTFLSSN
ncbi:amino acid ABC transporter permease [Collinsella sp. zg1085]|uniref:amino acid ABC transporter permease n=1 Tax=Collinsella sp. zg1085 TaxID=2844380 RepID=UPI001C0C1AB3|nr:amino acid ABC transporter permease [Collinsella sp. zg1085]QWT17816.1 amino acid ABC transporter permease [Collinsella sp. zg1085]